MGQWWEEQSILENKSCTIQNWMKHNRISRNATQLNYSQVNGEFAFGFLLILCLIFLLFINLHYFPLFSFKSAASIDPKTKKLYSIVHQIR